MREVKSRDWNAFCERINQNRRGTLVSVQKLELDGARTQIAHNTELEEIEFSKNDGCNDQILIHGSDKISLEHEIIEPIHIKLMESEGGSAFPSVVIEAENGITQIDFRPSIKAAWLDGLDLL